MKDQNNNYYYYYYNRTLDQQRAWLVERAESQAAADSYHWLP
jgi:hypothetical protein